MSAENKPSPLVMKFGGTSVGSPAAIDQAARIVMEQKARWEQVVVVVSAMAGVTDALLLGSRRAATGDESTYREIAARLAEQHTAVAQALLDPGSDLHSEMLGYIDRYLAEFTTLCHSVSVLGELTPRALDAITSLGERLSARLLASVLVQRGVPSQPVDATEIIVTDSSFQSAAPLMEPTRQRAAQRLGALLAGGIVTVVTGFISANTEGIVTTLGRGGSDYSAAILGDCLDASQVWIWTDVDGVMTADPRLVPNAQVIPLLSYSEVGELAYFGAKVLHPRTIRPVVDRGIPLWIKNTFNPTHPGTLVERQLQASPRLALGAEVVHEVGTVEVAAQERDDHHDEEWDHEEHAGGIAERDAHSRPADVEHPDGEDEADADELRQPDFDRSRREVAGHVRIVRSSPVGLAREPLTPDDLADEEAVHGQDDRPADPVPECRNRPHERRVLAPGLVGVERETTRLVREHRRELGVDRVDEHGDEGGDAPQDRSAPAPEVTD